MGSVEADRGKRRKLFVDSKVQGSLLLRTVGYWCFCLLTITLLLLCWRILTGPARMFYMHFDDLWFHFGPALVASFILLPMVLLDVLRVSNRFVGPMIRLRRAMHDLARGKHVQPVDVRDGDFWREFAVDFNALARQMQQQPRPEQGAGEELSETELVGSGK